MTSFFLMMPMNYAAETSCLLAADPSLHVLCVYCRGVPTSVVLFKSYD